MAGLTDTTLDQSPLINHTHRDIPPNEVREHLTHFDEVLEYLERLRRRIQRLIPHYHAGSATFNPANLADGAGETTTVTVTGAKLTDVALASFSLDVQGVMLIPWVSAADVVSVRFQNETGGAVNLAEGTLRAWTFTPPTIA